MTRKIEISDQLNAFVDGELDQKKREEILGSIDEDAELKAELCDIHRIKELMSFTYSMQPKKERAVAHDRYHYGAIAASLLLVLGVGFTGGYLSNSYFDNEVLLVADKPLDLNDSDSIRTVALQSPTVTSQNKVIIYLGHSQKVKFTQTLDKAEELLEKYRQDGTEVYVVTSAGGIDLLRSNTNVQKRITQMKDLHPSLRFVACNNQIYHLHKKGHPVNLVKEAEVAPSAVQFVVDHLKNGWRYIAI